MASATYYVLICRRKNWLKNKHFIRHVIWTALNRNHYCGLIWVKPTHKCHQNQFLYPCDTKIVTIFKANSSDDSFYTPNHILLIFKNIFCDFPFISSWILRNVPAFNSWILLCINEIECKLCWFIWINL